MDKIIKGKEYEIFINKYLNELDITKESYLWQNVPEQTLYDAGLITDYNEHRLKRKTTKINPLRDVGIDIIRINKNNNIDFV